MAKYRKFRSTSWADMMDEEDGDYGFSNKVARDDMAGTFAEAIITEHNEALLATVEEEVETSKKGVISTGLWNEEESALAGEQAKRDGNVDCFVSLDSVLAPPSSTGSSSPSSKSPSSTPSSPRQPSDQPHEVHALRSQHSGEDSQHSAATMASRSQLKSTSSGCQGAQAAGLQCQSMQQHLDTMACTMAQSGLGFPTRLFIRRDLLLLMWSTCAFRPEDDRDDRRAELERLLEADDYDDDEDAQDATAAGARPPPKPQKSVMNRTNGLQATAAGQGPSQVMPDGTELERESGEDFGPNGYRCGWSCLKGVSAVGKVEWEEWRWEESDWAGMREVGVTKRGRRADGAEWIGTWRDGITMYQTSGEPIAERSAHTWACEAKGAEWEERWVEQYWRGGRANRSADTWRKYGNNMWHERWGEEYPGNGWVRKHGSSSTGEQWDVFEPLDMCYNMTPYFTSLMAPDRCSPHCAHRSDTPTAADRSRYPQADTPRPQRRQPRCRSPQRHAPGKQNSTTGGFHKAAEHPSVGGAAAAFQQSSRGRSLNRRGSGVSAPPANDTAAQGSRVPRNRPYEAVASAPSAASATATQASSVQPPVAACTPTDSSCVPVQRQPERELGICTAVASAAAADAVLTSIAFGSFNSGAVEDASDEEHRRPEEQQEAQALTSGYAAAPSMPDDVNASIILGSFGSGSRTGDASDEEPGQSGEQQEAQGHAAAPSSPIQFGTFGEDLGGLPGSTEHLRRLDECETAMVAPAAEQPSEDVGQLCGSGQSGGSAVARSAARPLLSDAMGSSSAVQSVEATVAALQAAETSLEGVAEDLPCEVPHDSVQLSSAVQQSPGKMSHQQHSAQLDGAAPLLPAATQTSTTAPQCPPAQTCSNEVGEHPPLPVIFCSFLQAYTSKWLQVPVQVAVHAILNTSAAIAALVQTFMS
ncbi:hypothetical protein COCOBI_18-0310 [Coccomyxa sp. Obi]|nr:hypothetical protein COCOBI_18-0310 [Coccomyxa sp. Obi]